MRHPNQITAGIALAILVATLELIAPHAAAEPLLLCGGNEVFLIDTKTAESGTIEKLWRWSGDDVAGLTEAERRSFDHLDECKPIAGGGKLLVCASNGGCGLVELPSGKILWHAHATNAHTLELLPRNRVVVASSLSGDHLVLFDLARSDVPLWKTPLHSAHGLVWDDARRCLWALGFDELRCYELGDWETDTPSLTLKATNKLPSEDGHDLRAAPDSPDLLVTTEKAVYLFDRDKSAFRPYAPLADKTAIKSVDIHPKTGRVVVSEWSAVIRLLSPDGQIQTKPDHPYKARWLVEAKP